MILLVSLCLCLVLGGLAFRHQVRAAVEDLRLTLFGVRVKVPARPAHPASDRPVVAASRHVPSSPDRAFTWPAFDSGRSRPRTPGQDLS